jgi:group I intron endonuclease
MFYTIYKITNTINNKIYIGAHKTSNLQDSYMGSGKQIKAAIKKYGISNFKKEYIVILNNMEDMFNHEALLVNDYFVARDDTYNIMEGGKITPDRKGAKHSIETIKKLKENSAGSNNTQYGTVWVIHPITKICKKIHKSELDDYLNLGWEKGRKLL